MLSGTVSKVFVKRSRDVQDDACPDLWFQSDPLKLITVREPCTLPRRQTFHGRNGNTNFQLLGPTEGNEVDVTVLP